jgi:hypothetical protein
MTKPKFSTAVTLQNADFEDEPATNYDDLVAYFPVGATPDVNNWYILSMNSASAKSLVNLIGKTQLRLRFGTGDDNDEGADQLKFYSSDASGAHPQLIITYLP